MFLHDAAELLNDHVHIIVLLNPARFALRQAFFFHLGALYYFKGTISEQLQLCNIQFLFSKNKNAALNTVMNELPVEDFVTEVGITEQNLFQSVCVTNLHFPVSETNKNIALVEMGYLNSRDVARYCVRFSYNVESGKTDSHKFVAAKDPHHFGVA